MNINKFVDFTKKFRLYNNNGLDDFSDRLHFKYSGVFYSLCFMVVLIRQFLMKPIACYTANNIGGADLIEYLEYYCYVAGTVPVDFDKSFPDVEKDFESLNSSRTLYYQWVVYIFAMQMIMFYLPQFAWKMIYKNTSGRDLRPLVKLANNGSKVEGAERQQKLIEVTLAIEKTLFYNREIHTSEQHTITQKWMRNIYISKCAGNRLFALYMVIKLAYLINSIGQIFIMQNIFFTYPHNSSFYSFDFGIKLVSAIANGTTWENSLTFPRTAFCFAKIAQMGGINHAVAQCALPLNMLIEKIFIIVWFWCVVLSLSTLLTSSLWIWRMIYTNRLSYIVHHLYDYLLISRDMVPDLHKTEIQSLNSEIPRSSSQVHLKPVVSFDSNVSQYSLNTKAPPTAPPLFQIINSLTSKDEHQLNKSEYKRFLHDFLRIDGIFILRMIGLNSGEIFAGEVIRKLSSIYRTKYRNCNFNKAHDESDKAEIIKLDRPKRVSRVAVGDLSEPSAPLIAAESKC